MGQNRVQKKEKQKSKRNNFDDKHNSKHVRTKQAILAKRQQAQDDNSNPKTNPRTNPKTKSKAKSRKHKWMRNLLPRKQRFLLHHAVQSHFLPRLHDQVALDQQQLPAMPHQDSEHNHDQILTTRWGQPRGRRRRRRFFGRSNGKHAFWNDHRSAPHVRCPRSCPTLGAARAHNLTTVLNHDDDDEEYIAPNLMTSWVLQKPRTVNGWRPMTSCLPHWCTKA